MKNKRDSALKTWRMFAILWPILCMIFVGIILYQALQGTEERIFDIGFAFIPLVFFAIGMRIRYRLLKERIHATVLTRATVVSQGKRTRVGERMFFPEYEFQVGEISYHVTARLGYSVCLVSEGRQVELYYAPENPRIFYVPLMQRHDNRVSLLLCGVGVLWPLFGLFAPLMWALYEYLA